METDISGANNPNWRGGTTKAKCVDCGKEISNWKGGLLTVEQAIRSTKEFDSWVKAVKDRDARSCQRCHTKVGIETHHIIPLGIIIDGLRYRNSDAGDEEILSIAKRFALIWDISNGTTLCHKCHMGKHMKLRTEEYNPCQ